MEFFPSTRVFLEIGPLSIYWYAVFIVVGSAAIYYLSLCNVKKMGYSNEIAESLFLGTFISGILGARIWYCVFYNLEFYLANPIEIIQMWDGGLAIQGGIIGGLIYGAFFAKRHKLNFFRWADALVPNLLIAQAIGRLGNFVNQEAYGVTVSESFYDMFPAFFRDMMFIDGAYRMPTFLMEIVGNLIGFVLIIFVFKKYANPKRGDLAYAYLMWYGVVRFFVEGFRMDSLMFGPLRMAQITSLVFLAVGLFGMLGGFRKIFKSPKPIILWDLDGTILDTESAIIETYRQLFVKYSSGAKFDEDKQLAVLGPPLKEMFPIYFNGHNVDELIEEYREINMKLHESHVKLIPHVKETLEYLKQEGYQQGIVSTKFNESIIHGLKQFKIDELFDVVIGLDDVEKGKPAPEGIVKACYLLNKGIESVIYIGDSKTDIEAAKAAGVYSVGFIFNEKRKAVIVASKPNKVINDIKEVEEIVKENHEWTYNTR